MKKFKNFGASEVILARNKGLPCSTVARWLGVNRRTVLRYYRSLDGVCDPRGVAILTHRGWTPLKIAGWFRCSERAVKRELRLLKGRREIDLVYALD